MVEIHTNPNYSNVAYLHYSDLNEFIKEQAATLSSVAKYTLLDYGAGASPYKKYFATADYRRADITPSTGLHYHIRPDSTVPEADETFDVIVSTQVAEHVSNPHVYFGECFRLLKPGGQLILTTHGIWEEHGSPYDFQRWTEEGLKRDLRAAGFKNFELFKLTCGLRAALFFFSMALYESRAPEGGFSRGCFKAFRFLYSRVLGSLYRFSDRWFSDERVVRIRENSTNPKFYIVIAAVVRK